MLTQKLPDSKTKVVYLVTSGDLRLAANQVCWPAQQQVEDTLTQVLAREGVELRRAFPVDKDAGHGFISSQRMGMDVFRTIPADAPLLFATAAWQYTHHVLPGMRTHRGPILTVANWSGQWPGLVGLLNLNGSLVKAAVPFSTLWSETFRDEFFLAGLRQWLRTGEVTHNLSQVRDFDPTAMEAGAVAIGREAAKQLRERKAILGVFDEGCMGMYNAIIDDELLNPAGLYKERLSQSALVAKMRTIPLTEAEAVLQWLLDRGMHFRFGTEPATELTREQVLEQCRMYIAAVRIAHDFGCDAIGIQYQQGLKDTVPASDLVEGLLNNADRPPVYAEGTHSELYPGGPLVHFNEVDECAGVDALITNRVWTAIGLDPSTTLHDVRWGAPYLLEDGEAFVWVLQISGAAPPNHFVDGYAGASSDRQPPMYFPLGGGSLKGVGRPGPLVWSRVFVEGGNLHCDLGLADAVTLPAAETERRWKETTMQWPITHAVLRDITRDQFMARHRANHINIAYATDPANAIRALVAKAAAMQELGILTHVCGRVSQ